MGAKRRRGLKIPVSPLDREIGQRIRKQRMLVGLSQKNVAAAVGVTYQMVQKWEAGHNRIYPTQLILLADLINTTIQRLVGRETLPVELMRDDESVELAALARKITKPATRKAIRDLLRSLHDDDA